MDGLKTLRPSYEMEALPPRPSSTGKLLQLTPLWEHVLKYQRVPPELDQSTLFKELGVRLCDPEWEVRQHAVRFLVDLIPVVGQDLDALMIPNVLTELINNLGHGAPAVRKGALDTLRAYLNHSADPEAVLRTIITHGLENTTGAKTLQSNVAMGVILCISSLLFPLAMVVSQEVLVHLVSALSKKLVQVTYQEHALKALVNIRDMVGEARFDRFLEGFHAECKRDFDLLCQVYDVKTNLGDSGIDLQLMRTEDYNNSFKDEPEAQLTNGYSNWSNESSPLLDSSETPSGSPSRDHNQNLLGSKLNTPSKVNPRKLNNMNDSSFENQEVSGENEDDVDYESSDATSELSEYVAEGESVVSKVNSSDTVPNVLNSTDDHDTSKTISEEASVDEAAMESGRVILETEIKFSEQTAITMTILEEKSSQEHLPNTSNDSDDMAESGFANGSAFNNNFVMKVLADEDYDEPAVRRTPRRVRFGGEMVMMRTPDSDVVSENPEEGTAKTPDGDVVEPTVQPNQDSLPEVEVKRTQPLRSHIPLPIHPAVSKPRGSWRKGPVFSASNSNYRNQHVKEPPPSADVATNVDRESPIPTFDEGESLASSSDGEQLSKVVEDYTPNQMLSGNGDSVNWELLNIVNESTIEDLHNLEDWRARLRGLDHLSSALFLPDALQRVTEQGLPSLLDLLLGSLAVDFNHRVSTTSLGLVRALIQRVPASTLRANLPTLVIGLCRLIANSGSVNVNLEAVQAAKTLMQVVKPSPVIEILTSRKCLGAKSSKMRENSLLFILYATMTFPSTEFACEGVATQVLETASTDPRRRVRQAALDTLAVLGQLTGSKWLLQAATEVAAPRPLFLAALKARLARRQLPTISPDGLVLYALQIPTNSATPATPNHLSGADVEWILNGTGSLSAGSARARNHRRVASSGTMDSRPTIKMGNPWTDRRPSEMLAVGVGVGVGGSRGSQMQDNSVYGKVTDKNDMNDQRSWDSPMWTADLGESGHNFLHNAPQGFSVLPSRLASLALVERSNGEGAHETTGWSPPDRGSHSPRVLTPTRNRRRILEPISSPEHRASGRGTTPVRKDSSSEGRLRMPAITSPPSQDRLRDSGLNTITTLEHDRTQIIDHREITTVRLVNGNVHENARPKFRRHTKMPAHERRGAEQDLSYNYHSPVKGTQYFQQEDVLMGREPYYRLSPSKRMNNGSALQMNPPPLAVCSIPQRPLLARRETSNGPRPDSGRLSSPSPQEQCIPAVDTTSPSKPSSDDLDFTSMVDEEPMRNTTIADDQVNLEAEDRERAQKYMKLKEVQEEFASSGTPSASSNDVTEVMEITEVKEVAEFSQTAESEPQEEAQNIVNEMPTIEVAPEGPPNPPPTTRRISKRAALAAKAPTRQRAGLAPRGRVVPSCVNTRVYPDTLKPLDKPKESLNQYFLQMEQPEWEMTMQGLTLLVRLIRHHPDVAMTQLHSIVVSVVQQVRNLRSQVARAACQACGELFTAFKRGLDHELEDLSGALLHRTADTNKFLRADSNGALDLMLENCSPMKILQIVVTKGASHQNAIVRAVAARLLVCLTVKMGPEKALALPRETRDKVLNTGANFLMEGSLETRNYGKEFFRNLVREPNFSKILLEAIPQYTLRNINKTLKNL